MPIIKTSLIALLAFALGFLASEYRRAQLSLDLFAIDNAAIDSSPPYAHESSAAPITESPVNPHEASANKPINAAISTPAPDKLSLEHANQLIAQGHYDEAILLLQTRLKSHYRSAPEWLLLAHIYEQQKNDVLALDALFHYLEYEQDSLLRDQTKAKIKRQLLALHNQSALPEDKVSWLITQLDELLKLGDNDGELHVLLASLYVQQNDQYQAQYHALMAANDPAVQTRAEKILAELGGASTPKNLEVPLLRLGNQYLVEVYIEGQPARLLLDTGASLSGVSNAYAEKYPRIVKSTKPIRLNTAAGMADSYLFTVDHLTIGQLTFNQHMLTLLPMSTGTEFDGLLGIDILGRFDFVIDQDALLLRLKARKN